METTTTDAPSEAPAYLIDESAFREAFRSHGATVLRYATSRVGPQLGEDVAAETFVEAWRRRERYDAGAGSIDAWILGIATRVIARHRRAERRWLQMCADTAVTSIERPEGDDLDSRIDATARRPELARALRGLTSKERDPLLLQLLADMSTDDIATALGLPAGTIRSRLTRARARLTTQLDGGDHD